MRRILLIDGRSVLGWDEWYGIMRRYGLGMTQAVVSGLIEAGLLAPAPVEALSALLFGALNEAAIFVATAEDPPRARDEMSEALATTLASLRT